jgi:hypothetical protein
MSLLLPFLASSKIIPAWSVIFQTAGLDTMGLSNRDTAGEWRQVIKAPAGGWPKACTKLRLILGAALDNVAGYNRMNIDHTSIGILKAGTLCDTVAAPINVMYGGVAALSPPLPAYGWIGKSDDISLNLGQADGLVVHFDWAAQTQQGSVGSDMTQEGCDAYSIYGTGAATTGYTIAAASAQGWTITRSHSVVSIVSIEGK